MEISCDYSGYFIKKKYTGNFAHGLMALGQNGNGPLRGNKVSKTLCGNSRQCNSGRHRSSGTIGASEWPSNAQPAMSDFCQGWQMN